MQSYDRLERMIMRSKTLVVSVLTCLVALLATFQYGHASAQGTPAPVSKIGVVSIRTVLNECVQQQQYQNQVMARQGQIRNQLNALQQKINSDEATLKTYKAGTEDYLKQLQAILESRSKLDSQQEFFKQQRAIEYKKWNEKLYQEILKIVDALAEEKGLDMILERTEPRFPTESLDELVAAFSTFKVLNANGCVDLTPEVVKRLNALGDLKP